MQHHATSNPCQQERVVMDTSVTLTSRCNISYETFTMAAIYLTGSKMTKSWLNWKNFYKTDVVALMVRKVASVVSNSQRKLCSLI